jgi:hypothetical protein
MPLQQILSLIHFTTPFMIKTILLKRLSDSPANAEGQSWFFCLFNSSSRALSAQVEAWRRWDLDDQHTISDNEESLAEAFARHLRFSQSWVSARVEKFNCTQVVFGLWNRLSLARCLVAGRSPPESAVWRWSDGCVLFTHYWGLWWLW